MTPRQGPTAKWDPAHGPSEAGPGDAEFARDISALLSGWDYQPGTINVRKIVGTDGSPKLQMRLDLGLLQMELTGRPDGVRPHGFESLLDYFEKQLAEHKEINGTELGFHLTRNQCESLRHEAAMYYQRYLSLFVLEEFPGVVRDTARNLRVLDLCGRYAVDEQDRLWLEQYRPYILMMNARALASMQVKENKLPEALRTVRVALKRIREFFHRFHQAEAFRHSNEVKVLKKFGREIKKRMPIDPLDNLKRQLEKAVEAERYEEAARLRDEIERYQANGTAGEGN
jgi:hypothetical protein